MSNEILQEKAVLPEGFAKWAKKYFGKKVEEEVTLDLEALFNNEYMRIRESLRPQLKNAAKLPEFGTLYADRLKKVDDDQNLKDLQSLVKEIREALSERRDAVAEKIEKLHGDVLFAQLDLKRDPNEARDTVNRLLKTWDIAEAEREVKLFEEQIKRSKSMNPGELDDLEKRHENAKLQNAQYARNTQQVKAIATRLIGPDGKLILEGDKGNLLTEFGFAHGDDLPMLIQEIRDGGKTDLPQSEHALAMLKKLQKNKDLRDQLEAMVKPTKQDGVAAQLIRDTLGLEPGTEVTDVHTRQAALSSLLYQTRQGAVGSCFATAIVCSTQRNEPKQFLKDLSDLFANGELTRTTIENGTRRTIKIPLNKEVVRKTVEKKTDVSRKDSDLHLAPDMVGAMNALKIPPDEQQKAFEAAAREIRAERALDEALANTSIPDTYFAPPNEREKVRKDVLDALRKDSTLTIKKALQAVFNMRNMTLTTGIDSLSKAAGGRRKRDALAKCGSYDADGKDQISPQELIERMAKMRLPENEQKAAIKSGSDAFLGQQDNLMLRAYEYTIATATDLVEQSGSKKRHMTVGAMKAGEDFLKDEFDAQTSWSVPSREHMDDFASKLLNKFHELLTEKTETRYNPSAKTRTDTTAPDGHSSSGGFSLYYKDKEIDNEKDYKTAMKELLREASGAVVPGLHPWVQNKAPAYVDKLVAEFGKSTFHEKIVDKLVSVASMDKNTMPKPWAKTGGGQPRNILQVTRNLDAPPQQINAPTGTDNAEKLANFLVDTLKTMKVDKQVAPDGGFENSSITVNTSGLHSFNLLPGSPQLQTILNYDDKDPKKGLAKYKEIELEKQATRGTGEFPLADPPEGQIKKMIESGTSFFKDIDKPNIVADINSALKATGKDKITLAEVDVEIGKKVKAWLQTLYPTLSPTEHTKWCDKAKTNTAAQISQAIVPQQEFEPLIDLCLQRLKIPPEKHDKIHQELKKTLKGKKSIDRTELTKTIEDEFRKQDAGAETAKFATAMQAPMGIVIADFNWGGGDHRILGSMVVNPVSGEFELWQMNEDGTGAGPMDQKKWIKDTEWQVFGDPGQFGGMTGHPAVEKKRGEQQEKLDLCVKERIGDILAMQAVMDLADQRIAETKFDLAEAALTKLDKMTKDAEKLAANVKQAFTDLDGFSKEIAKAAVAGSKGAEAQIKKLVADLKFVRKADDIDTFLKPHAKLCELLKNGKDPLGVAVDVTAILKQPA